MEKEFPRIGSRNLNLSGVESQRIEKAEKCYCPKCGAGPMDGITGVCMAPEGATGPAPELSIEPGDGSICSYCASLVTYQEEPDGMYSLREMTRADISRLKADPDRWGAFMKLRDFIEGFIDQARIEGNRKYAGATRKTTL